MKVQSFSDIITNSSSELFVFNDGKSVEEVIKKLNSIYPDWKNEYHIPDYLKNNTDDNINMYTYYSLGCYMEEIETDYLCKLQGIKPYMHICGRNYYGFQFTEKDFNKNNCYALKIAEKIGGKPKKVFSNWNTYNPFSDDYGRQCLEYSPYGIQLFKQKYANYVLLWSIDENPDWEYQKKIMNIAKRYHLG
ncbi:MAG: hypothetical protein [Wendovervirus sonii]|uniref:Uncharacterized protein n=1 Tax=phage Lak_Megaphage_Sonny TaxID=3109229 RepID=A0ABZ0Z5S3_9CAUD|nr:MAG: hypothetical protein [phage Lak_Megaphage_Sonny]